MSFRSQPLKFGAMVLATSALASAVHAASVIEEVVVTATKQESSLQDTAIAVSAFDQASLDRENIDDALDVQFSVPNLSFTKGNFTGSNLRIRGIGNNAVAASSDSGTAIAFNGAYLQTSAIFESEFFDVQRVEVLRGPQGTLYGRNTTGGVVNIIPAKANPEGFEASVDLQAGNYGNQKGYGMLNFALGENAAVRVSGMKLERDGYVENTFNGDEYDDRDLWSTRVALNWLPTDSTEVNFFWQHFEEDDQRMRTSNQTCAPDPRPFPLGIGCLPNQDIEANGVLNSSAQLGGVLASLLPDLASGNSFLPFSQNGFENSVRTDDLRKVNTDFAPTYQMEEDIYNLEVVQDWSDYTITVGATYQEISYFTQTDYDWAAPAYANAAAGGASTFTPNISYDALFGLAPGTLGLGYTDGTGALITPADPTTSGFFGPYTYDTSAYENESFTLEARIASNWEDVPFDFLAGFFYLESENSTIYDVRANGLSAFTAQTFGDGPDGRPAPLAFYRNDTDDYRLDTYAAFGEFYADINDSTRLTIGLRYSSETKQVADRQTLLNNPALPYEEGISGRAFQTGALAGIIGPGGFLAPFLGGEITDPTFLGYGATGNDPIPPYRNFKAEFNELTGKVGIDHYLDLSWTDESLVFASLSRSYKSGGINPPSFSGAFDETFEPEYINAVEIGAKNRLMDGAMQANLTYFFYDFEGLQTSKIIDRTSVNENIDAEIQGLEFELNWYPIENLRIDGFASWLDTEITGGTSINPADPTNSDPNYITLKNTGTDVFIAPVAAIGDPTYSFDQTQCGQNNLECTTIFNANPAAAAGGAGLATPSTLTPVGIAADLSGNQLPGSPEFSVKMGVQYSFYFGNGMELVPRLDYYWQDEFYYRVYNSRQDKIDSWDVVNASMTLYGGEGSWYVEGFVKNLMDEDYITGGYFTDYSSGNFTNVFVLEPQTYGLTLGARF
ncbi:MAG TPA: TonB-dependent receptor [Pseudomonadales bacterium]|nr:TonB-dependent receptor [Pseudomonadales bacterium]